MPPLHPEISEQLRAPSGTAQVEIAVVVDPTVSLCLQQNSVPLVKRILLKNVGATALTELSVRVRAEPVFALPLSLGVAALGPGEQRTLDSVDLLLTPEYLVALTETGRGLLHVEVDCAGRTVGSHAQTVEVLAYDQWSGSRSLVELLAAFVMPNHPVVEHLLGESATLLRASSLSDAFDGYQRESRNAVQHMVGAIYEAVRREGLGYIMPPASFEESGQKIRTPERVLQNRMGTCLDLTLLLAACFEQAGLHPLVVLLKGHAFVGVWLEERTLSTASDDDPIELRKRIDAGEMLAIESTLLTGAQSQPFDKAVKQGRQHLDDVTKFHFAVDVTRARKAMIRPMHGRVADNGVFQPMARLVERPLNNGPLPAMQVLREAIVLPQAADDVGETRLDRWRRKLLDLTLNNRLLNFRHGAKTLPVLCPDLGRFEDLLADGAQFQLRARPEEFSTKDTRDGASYKRSTGDDAVSAVLREALSGKRLHIDLDQAVLDRRVLEIYREARLAHEESGTSALYCALGFLNWYQSDDSDRPRSAPLLLLPVNLVRASVDQGFKLEVGDDEPRVNVSLLELLQQDFEMAVRGLDPLPTDEHGIDVRRVFDLFRSAVAGMKRWEVIEDVQVGFFSFSKFLMWRDLQEHAADLLQNSVVNHLVHHRTENFDPGGPIPKAEALDRERPPAMMFCPMSADSSQLAAVFAAADGRSFVLEGPPGTGKSQTITNIIAQCLALGKSVLFVAEKNVALNVVHERLEASGLGEYCLELHSNKAKKTDVMRQLERAMARAPSGEPPEWARTSQRVEHLRRNLNEYVSALHRPRVSGESVYQGLAHLIGHSAVPLVRLDFGALGRVDQGQLATLRELAQRIQTVGGSLGPVGSHPWRFVTRGGWDPLWQRKVEQHLAALLHAIDDVTARLEEAVRILGLAGGSRTVAQLSLLAEASGVLIGPPYVPAAMVVESDWAQLQRRISAVLEVGRRRDAVRERVRRTFSDAVIQADLSPVLATLKAAAAAWAPLRWLRRVLVRRGLRPLFLPGRDLPLDALQGDVEHALALKQEETSLATLGAPVAAALGALYDGGEGRWDDIQRAMTWTGSARSAAMAIAADNPSEAAAVRRRWAELAAEAPEALAQSAPKGQALGMFVRAVRALEAHAAVFEAETGKAPGSLLNSGPSADLAGVTASLRELAKLTSRLRGWCQWKEVRDAAVGARLAPIVEALEGGQVAAGDVSAVLDKAYYQWFTEHTLNEDAVLRAFHSSEHGRLIAEFGLADTAHQALSGDAIRARLSTRVPASDAAAGKGSALGILRKETQKKKRHMAVRALLGETGDVVMRLTPCFLMSPISVAQYLDPRMPKFDVVIFDEASQIPAWEAVGAIARGRTAVIVGDPKQLPPTSFFGRGEQEEGGDSELEELESILDDCIGGGLPWLRLRWHYRSRHESLIAFSNHHYYDNKLLTLPSADTKVATDRGVSFRYVADGIYDKGKSRTNRREAETVVAEVVRRLAAPGASGSIGIVTFNTEQRTLIEDLLDAARRAEPAIETHFAEGRNDRVFIKNLENVQGDERDVIFFSIGYGPDATGRVSMNFGPMNREGGHRRLNVAITRARCEVVVFSSLRADQLDLTRTQARGVYDLRAFLDYAERGITAIREASTVRLEREFDSPFEEDVCNRLRKLGWDVIPQVGCSGYRIDLGIVDPNARGRFLMGVECDGAAYHSAASARDRDKLRANVLVGLGWKLYRVWSTDFWQDADGEIQKLHSALEREVAVSRGRPEAAAKDRGVVQRNEPAPAVLAVSSNPTIVEAQVAVAPVAVKLPAAGHDKRRPGSPYVIAALGRKGTPESFYDPATEKVVAEAVQHTLQREGPISIGLLTRRVTEAWAFGRTTAQAQERIKALLDASVRREIDEELLFLWPPGIDPLAYEEFRLHDGPLSQREAPDLPLTEVRNAALYVLRSAGGAPSEEVAREVARLFGFQRMGSRVAGRMSAGVRRLVEHGWAVENAGRLVAVR